MTSNGGRRDARPWAGSWVADRLAVRVAAEAGKDGGTELPLTDLVGLAVRRNPRRAHLLVSTVLGKHLPTDPTLVYAAGRLLGLHVAELLDEHPEPLVPAFDALLGKARALLHDALQVGTDVAADLPTYPCDAAAELLELCQAAVIQPADGVLVLGYAETATALGHCVADSLAAPYLHSTRRDVAGAVRFDVFEEEHSHATTHLLLPDDATMIGNAHTIVLVDDELSTGRTALNTVRILSRSAHPRRRFVIACLADVRAEVDRRRLDDTATELGVRIDVVSLASGHVMAAESTPHDAVALIARYDQDRSPDTSDPACAQGRLICVPMVLPKDVPESGRHGFAPELRVDLELAVDSCAGRLSEAMSDNGGASDVLVLGAEEFMYVPLRLAMALTSRLGRSATVRFSTTTRSPVVAVDEDGYAIRTVMRFGSHEPSEGSLSPRFAYNLAQPRESTSTGQPRTRVVLVVDDVAETDALQASGGLVPQLRARYDDVYLVVVPTRGPQAAKSATPATGALPEPLRGPAFGSYAADEVAWLLTDLSAAVLEQPTDEREEAIQAGRAHYAESLPIEFQPSAQYQDLFHVALDKAAAQVAFAVGVVSEQVLNLRGPDVVLVSLARAGTPIGILMRRWLSRVHDLSVPHYAASIVRGRGLDTVALRYLAAHHRPSAVMFVDGWTGKGAIARELVDALASANRVLRLPVDDRFSPELAVLADPGSCVRIFGTRQDYLIPSACLNSTVSGLVSRTVLNRDLIGVHQFHGAKFYSHLRHADVSAEFLDKVTASFASVRDAVATKLIDLREETTSIEPSWDGWQSVAEIGRRYGIDNLNLIKPGVGETTRVLLRRVPWKVLMRPDAAAELAHVRHLASERGTEIEYVEGLPYGCIGLIHPGFKADSAIRDAG